MRAARRSWTTICARSGRSSRRREPTSARSTGPASCSRSTSSPSAGDAGGLRPDAPGLGSDLRARLLAGLRRRAGVLEGAARRRLRDGRCLGGSAGCPGGWSGIARARCTPVAAPDRGLRRLLGELGVGWIILEPRDSQAKGAIENWRRFSHELRAGPEVRQRARLPAPARPLVRAGQRAPHRTTRAVVWTGSPRSGCDAAAARGCRTPTAGSSRASRRIPTCASTATTTRSTRGWPASASRCA